MPRSNALAEMKAAMAISAGPPSRLVHRRDLRQDTQNASATATRVAAGAPKKTAERNMKVSPAVIEDCVLGMRVGRKPTRTTSAIRVVTPTSLPRSIRATPAVAKPTAATPPSVEVHQ